jgi:hypothetical protein
MIRDKRLQAKVAGKVTDKRQIERLSKSSADNSCSDDNGSNDSSHDDKKDFVFPRKSFRVCVVEKPVEEAPLEAKKAAGGQFGKKSRHAAQKRKA